MLNLFRAAFAPPRDLILLLATGWVGLWIAGRACRQAAIAVDQLESLVMWMSVAFLAGGRLSFAVEHVEAFIQSPLSLVSLNVSLFDALGGLVCAALTAAIVMQRSRLPALPTLDLLAPFLAALSVGLALSHLASGAAFGRETHAPWAITLWGAQRHPTQLYEAVAGLMVLAVVWWRRGDPQPGRVFLLWLALTAASRLVIEGFRGDSTLVFGGLRLAAIIAWLILAAALTGMELLQRHPDATANAADQHTNKKARGSM